MSYDLFFWRQEPGARQDPRAVYEALVDECAVEGLLRFPVEEYLAAVAEAFPAAVREPVAGGRLVWQSPNQRSMFEITWSPVHVRATLRSVETDDGNRLVDIAAGLGARSTTRRKASVSTRGLMPDEVTTRLI